MLEVRRKLHTSVDHTPATPVWLFASEHSASSLHTWELHSARFAKLNTLSKKVVILRFFCQGISASKELLVALKGRCCQIQAELGSDGTWAKEFPWEDPIHPTHTDWVAMSRVQLRETHPEDSDRWEPSDQRTP
ncbi:MAG TPA: hypothetical protein DEF45_02440 [Rhodopirellula sp.]|nr:hypothetical protein [Rhodopirellula sp.]